MRGRLNECLETILNKAQEPPKSKKVQHSNAKNAVLFEAISLIIHNDSEPNLLVRACNQLGQFLSNRETNLRYLALESMCHLATSEFSHEAVKKHQEVVILSMKMEKDVSVRQQAVDLLYAMCDKSNAEEIVQEMLNYLETADYSIREEMVLKVAILAEKYATDYTWYVDVILNLIRIAGDYVSEEVWYRVIQIVINRDDVQGYAAKTVFEVRPSFPFDFGFSINSSNHSLIRLTKKFHFFCRRCKRPLATKTWLKLAVTYSGSLVISSPVISGLLRQYSFSSYIPK